MKVPMTAKQKMRYANREMSAGDSFSAETEAHARILSAAGKAERSQQYATRVMTAETVKIERMDADELRALASRMGVKVHHRAGAEKLRQVLRQAGV